jgi:hypothetical protein
VDAVCLPADALVRAELLRLCAELLALDGLPAVAEEVPAIA